MTEFKRPESVLVVVHTPRFECLLLERVSPRGFWQSVTGALRWGETPAAAAVREMREETGLVCEAPVSNAACASGYRVEGARRPQPPMPVRQPAHDEAGVEGAWRRRPPMLTDAKIKNRFRILPEWRRRFAPGVTDNVEHLLYLELPTVCEVTFNAEEHVGFRWMGLDEATRKVASWTNREALERLRTPPGVRRWPPSTTEP